MPTAGFVSPPDGVFWTTAIHPKAFTVNKNGAVLKLRKLPLCNNFVFGSGQGVSAMFNCTVRWKAAGKAVPQGMGKEVDATAPNAFLGEFAPASCTARAKGVQTGFAFHTDGKLDSKDYWAQVGHERNGAML